MGEQGKKKPQVTKYLRQKISLPGWSYIGLMSCTIGSRVMSVTFR